RPSPSGRRAPPRGRGRHRSTPRGTPPPPASGSPPAPPRSGSPARPAGERRDDRDLVAGLERSAETAQLADLLTVHVDVDVVVDLAQVVSNQSAQPLVAPLEGVEEALHVRGFEIDTRLTRGRPPEWRRDVHAHRHGRLLPVPGRRPIGAAEA